MNRAMIVVVSVSIAALSGGCTKVDCQCNCKPENGGVIHITGTACGKEVLEEDGNDGVIDAALIAAAQRVEHYEMAAYGTVKTLASLLGHDKVAKLLDETLGEEKAADEKLTDVAESSIYPGTPKDEDDMSGEVEEAASKPRVGAKKKLTKSGK